MKQYSIFNSYGYRAKRPNWLGPFEIVQNVLELFSPPPRALCLCCSFDENKRRKKRNHKRLIALIGYTFAVLLCLRDGRNRSIFDDPVEPRRPKCGREGRFSSKTCRIKKPKTLARRFFSVFGGSISSRFSVLLALSVPIVFFIEPPRRNVTRCPTYPRCRHHCCFTTFITGGWWQGRTPPGTGVDKVSSRYFPRYAINVPRRPAGTSRVTASLVNCHLELDNSRPTEIA